VNIHNLDSIFKPKRVAMLGIGMNPKSVGGKILSNLVSGFWSRTFRGLAGGDLVTSPGCLE